MLPSAGKPSFLDELHDLLHFDFRINPTEAELERLRKKYEIGKDIALAVVEDRTGTISNEELRAFKDEFDQVVADEYLLMQERDWYGFPWNNDITNYSMVDIRKEAANQIAEGYLNGPGWELELDIGKIIKEDGVDTAVKVVQNIAGFVESGLDSGISPFWRFVLEK